MSELLPVDYEGRHKRFREFKEDILERLAKHMAEHPEDSKEGTKLIPGMTDRRVQNDRVRVVPSNYNDGGWCVFKNGELMKSFYGQEAWLDATRYSNELINGTGDKA